MADAPTFEPTIQTENIAFDPQEMRACVKCKRSNPPNRPKCLYCGGELAVSVEEGSSIKPALRRLELWERGFNVIVRKTIGRPNVAAAADLLSTGPDDITAILNLGPGLPIARVESETDASIVCDRLATFGIGCSIVSDAALAAEKPPVRLSSIEFLDTGLAVTDFNTADRTEIDVAQFVLLVPGVIRSGRVDALEKKRRGKQAKVLDETETASDETLLDLYTRDDSIGFRVHLAGFDFSCLCEDKGLLASENLRLLIVRLAEHLPNAKLANGYAAARHALGCVWEVETRKDPKGLQRSGFGKVGFGSTASSSNLGQFTKYSRLQWHLL
jgi:hypothetical protein